MQNIITNVRCKSTKGTVVDQYNNPTNDIAELTLYTESTLQTKLFKGDSADSAYTNAELSAYNWTFFADADYDTSTTPKIAVTTGITATGGYVCIPIATTSATLIAWLGSSERKTIHAELQGRTTVGSTYPDFVVQFDIAIRNRVFYAGDLSNIDLSAMIGGQSLLTVEQSGANKVFKLTLANDATKSISFVCNGTAISSITATDGVSTFTM